MSNTAEIGGTKEAPPCDKPTFLSRTAHKGRAVPGNCLLATRPGLTSVLDGSAAQANPRTGQVYRQAGARLITARLGVRSWQPVSVVFAGMGPPVVWVCKSRHRLSYRLSSPATYRPYRILLPARRGVVIFHEH